MTRRGARRGFFHDRDRAEPGLPEDSSERRERRIVPQALCINHPTRIATARCKRCARPICNDCKMVSEVGVVCSQQCLDAIKTFQDRVGEDVPKRARHGLMSKNAVKALMAAVVLFALAYGILCLRAGRVLSLDDVLDQLRSWLWAFGSIFR